MFTFEDYVNEAGQRSLSAQIHVMDLPGQRNDFPESLRAEAMIAASTLQDAFTDLAQSLQIQHDLVVGARLDPRKRHAVGVALRRGEVDPAILRPYQRRSMTIDLPRIAVVGSAGVLEVNSESDYIGRIATLTLAVGWACETVGIDVTAVLMEGHHPRMLDPKQPYREAQLAYVLIEPGTATHLQAYSVALNRNRFYGDAYIPAVESDRNAWRRMAALQGYTPHSLPAGGTYPGIDGGNGVHWARTILESDLVIGIGKLTDLERADIKLGSHFEIARACEEIAAQARQLQREAP